MTSVSVNCPCCDQSFRRDNLNVSHIATHSVEMRDAMTPEDRDRCVTDKIPVVFRIWNSEKACGSCLVCKKSCWKLGGLGTRDSIPEFVTKHKESCGAAFDSVLYVFEGRLVAKPARANKTVAIHPFAVTNTVTPTPDRVIASMDPTGYVISQLRAELNAEKQRVMDLEADNERLRDRLTSAEAAMEGVRTRGPMIKCLLEACMEHAAGKISAAALATMMLDARETMGLLPTAK